MLPHKDGFEILNTLKSEKIETPVIILGFSILNYTNTIKTATLMMDRFSNFKDKEMLDKQDSKFGIGNKPESDIEIEIEGLYFIEVKDSNIVSNSDTSNNEELKEYAIKVSNSNKETGIIGKYIYKIRKNRDNNTMIILMENEKTILHIRMLLIFSLVAIVLSLLIIYSIIEKFINDINLEIMYQYKSSNKMIVHYLDTYKNIPLWVLVRILSFGKISKFYSLMKQKEQNAISRKYNLRISEFKIYLQNLTLIRNICAHDEKLYDIKMKSRIFPTEYHKKLNIEKNNKYQYATRDLFSIIIVLKILLEKKVGPEVETARKILYGFLIIIKLKNAYLK